jgi:hypothetical protein
MYCSDKLHVDIAGQEIAAGLTFVLPTLFLDCQRTFGGKEARKARAFVSTPKRRGTWMRASVFHQSAFVTSHLDFSLQFNKPPPFLKLLPKFTPLHTTPVPYIHHMT